MSDIKTTQAPVSSKAPALSKPVPKAAQKAPAKKAVKKAPAKTARTKAEAKVKKAILTNKCLCGCGKLVKNSFAQGHDARLKGMLLRGEVKNPSAEQKAFAKSHGVKIGSQKAA